MKDSLTWFLICGRNIQGAPASST